MIDEIGANCGRTPGGIRSAMTADGDVLVYGCDVAAGDVGQQFVAALAASTDADIAASTDITGAASPGGNWDLEAHVGDAEIDHVVLGRILAEDEGDFGTIANLGRKPVH